MAEGMMNNPNAPMGGQPPMGEPPMGNPMGAEGPPPSPECLGAPTQMDRPPMPA